MWQEHREKYVTNSSLLGLSRYRELNKIIFSNTNISGSSPCPILLRPVPYFSNPIYRIWDFIGPCFILKTGSFMPACAICRHETTPCHTCNVLLHIHCFSPFHDSSWTNMLKFPIFAENGYSSEILSPYESKMWTFMPQTYLQLPWKTIMPLLLVVMTNNNGIKGTHFQILYIGFLAQQIKRYSPAILTEENTCSTRPAHILLHLHVVQ